MFQIYHEGISGHESHYVFFLLIFVPVSPAGSISKDSRNVLDIVDVSCIVAYKEIMNFWMFYSMKGFLAALVYGSVSIAMAFLNKTLLSYYNFNQPIFIFLIQMCFAVSTIEALKCVKLVSIASYSFSKAKVMFLASLFCTLHSIFALIALKGMNIPMYSIIKRCTPLVNLILSVLYLKKPVPSNFIISSILLITVGCIVAGFGDLTFDVIAYSIGIISVLIQGVYQTLIQKVSEQNHTILEIFYYNSYNCLFYTSVCFLTNLNFLLCFFTVTFMGILLNYSLFLCTNLNSALTTSVVGILKSVIQTVVGFFTFGGVSINPLNILGIALNTGGTIMYSVEKLREKPKKMPIDINRRFRLLTMARTFLDYEAMIFRLSSTRGLK
uniref:Sugar phosphate transporter domain-containing protein n=1 Tax=Strigamia maritima TaxID=126957 RepID=T1ITF7_STRMM